jgi:predicted acyltransferase (DUF342 family)
LKKIFRLSKSIINITAKNIIISMNCSMIINMVNRTGFVAKFVAKFYWLGKKIAIAARACTKRDMDIKGGFEAGNLGAPQTGKRPIAKNSPAANIF